MEYPKVLSENFTWAEAEVTTHREIDNSIPQELWPVIINTAHGMERVRVVLGYPISVSSWYRCLQLNRDVRSADTSQHVLGEAVDWICPRFGTPVQVAHRLMRHSKYVRFDQLILEHRWVHISFKHDPASKNRDQVLSLLKHRDPETGRQYADGLTDNMGNPYYV